MKTFRGYLAEATKKSPDEREYNKVHKFWTSQSQGGSHKEDGLLHKDKDHVVYYHHNSDRGARSIVVKHPAGHKEVYLDAKEKKGETHHDSIEKQIHDLPSNTKKVVHKVAKEYSY